MWSKITFFFQFKINPFSFSNLKIIFYSFFFSNIVKILTYMTNYYDNILFNFRFGSIKYLIQYYF